MSIQKVVDALNGAFAADPGAMRALMVNHVPCNMALANDPFVVVAEDRNLAGDHFNVGTLGVINGVLAAAGMPLVAARWDMREDGPNVFAGFMAYIPTESVCVADQSPQPDQYWQHKKSDDRVYFIGRTPEGTMVWQCEGDPVEVGNLDWSEWEYLPGCDSWEWQSETVPSVPEYPKYWETDGPTFAYIVQTSRHAFKVIKKDGSEIEGGWWRESDERGRRQLTAEQVLAIERKHAIQRAVANTPEPSVVQYPQWLVPRQPTYWKGDNRLIAYTRHDSEVCGETFLVDGESFTYSRFCDDSVDLEVVTEAEAKSHVNPPSAEKKFPQYVKDCCGMIFRADSPDRIFWLPSEGGEHLQDDPAYFWSTESTLSPLTEFEIGEIVNRSIQAEVKAPSDVMGQSPDDWVILDAKYDDCKLRSGYQFRMLSHANDWRIIDSRHALCGELIKNERHDACGTWEFRCKRSDLPVLNARIPVSLYWYDGTIVGRYADSPVADPSFVPIHSDSNGGWFIERSDNAGN